MQHQKYVYLFNQGNRNMVNLLGGKGANLAYMANKNLPVPPGFTISTKACNDYYLENKIMFKSLVDEIFDYLSIIEDKMDKKLGDDRNPLLVSVRSGSPISMPGMMDTVLNLGLNDINVEYFSDNKVFAYDTYRRFIQIFSSVVLEIDHQLFENMLNRVKEKYEIVSDIDLNEDALKELILEYKAIVFNEYGKDFEQDPHQQLMMAIKAVFDSWHNPRAKTYRQLYNISESLGTAVNIQAMVFGNKNNQSGTGVLFTRNPSSGDNEIFGEYLLNAQGEDVVAGIRTPQPISVLQQQMPKVYNSLIAIVKNLENSYKDMQDVEFSIEDGKLYLLQTRSGKRSAQAALKIANDMYEEGIVDKISALTMIEPEQLQQLLHPSFDLNLLGDVKAISKGLPASPGAASGKIYFDSNMVVEKAKLGEKVILVRHETTPNDIEGLIACEATLTSTGGMTSHAAVVARGMGVTCVVGCQNINIDYKNKVVKIGEYDFNEGDYISVDGSTGNVYAGIIATKDNVLPKEFNTIMNWADEYALIDVKVNADNALDAQLGLDFKARGIGLCRTEHMFFKQDRLLIMQKMILAQNKAERIKYLDILYDYQKEDFKEIFKVMKDLPVTIRLLDPPFHEFLPHTNKDIQLLATQLKVDTITLNKYIDALKEVNPMLGHRGCRLAITYPEIYEMQTKAIINAVNEVSNELNIEIRPNIKIPLVSTLNELLNIKKVISEVINECNELNNSKVIAYIGVMIETPRACLIADSLANEVDFISYGTNDLTQLTYGFSRDDFSKFNNDYIAHKILAHDPFISLDDDGVGALIKIAQQKIAMVNNKIPTGICGEHGGEVNSIILAMNYGLNYVSCSPYRIALAKLVIAQNTAYKLLKNQY